MPKKKKAKIESAKVPKAAKVAKAPKAAKAPAKPRKSANELANESAKEPIEELAKEPTKEYARKDRPVDPKQHATSIISTHNTFMAEIDLDTLPGNSDSNTDTAYSVCSGSYVDAVDTAESVDSVDTLSPIDNPKDEGESESKGDKGIYNSPSQYKADVSKQRLAPVSRKPAATVAPALLSTPKKLLAAAVTLVSIKSPLTADQTLASRHLLHLPTSNERACDRAETRAPAPTPTLTASGNGSARRDRRKDVSLRVLLAGAATPRVGMSRTKPPIKKSMV
ncbi:hypothetical protein LPJ66_010617 [Kickxella alabastrina]|uniref:Uncharacterized protein n=1 Tax=Kickxella alabastrina TaxID=61397 RepID=A0ACC1HZZ6_9FUNG|nr:hypothetical protein LPJ66_010617 [Kickxella alabastrina]